MTIHTGHGSARKGQGADGDPLNLVREAIASLKFGGIQLTVHDGKLVQVDITEKHRFT